MVNEKGKEVNGYPTEVTLDWTEFDEHAKTLEFDN